MKKFYLAAQKMLSPNPPTKISQPITLPVIISNPPIRIAAAGPVPALKLENIPFSPPLIIFESANI